MLEKSGVRPKVMLDFSHANSRKKYQRQRYVCRDVCSQLSDGDERIMGVMIESNLVEGRQDQMPDRELVRGQSITCLLYTSPSPRDGLLSRMPSSA